MIGKLKTKTLRLLVGNIVFLFVLSYVLLHFVLDGLTGFFEIRPFVTDAYYYGALLVLVITIILLYNWACFIGFGQAFRILQGKVSYHKHKLLILLLGSTISIIILFKITAIEGYFVQPYSKKELAQITWAQWDQLNSDEKLRIGQSYYWEFKGRIYGLYKPSDYVALIESLHNRYVTDTIDQAVFLNFCGC